MEGRAFFRVVGEECCQMNGDLRVGSLTGHHSVNWVPAVGLRHASSAFDYLFYRDGKGLNGWRNVRG